MKLFLQLKEKFSKIIIKLIEKGRSTGKNDYLFISISKQFMIVYNMKEGTLMDQMNLDFMVFLNIKNLFKIKEVIPANGKEFINICISTTDLIAILDGLKPTSDDDQFFLSLGQHDNSTKFLRVLRQGNNFKYFFDAKVKLLANKGMREELDIIFKGFFTSQTLLIYLEDSAKEKSCMRVRIKSEFGQDEVKLFYIYFSDIEETYEIEIKFKKIFSIHEQWIDKQFKFETVLSHQQIGYLWKVLKDNKTQKFIIGLLGSNEIFFQEYVYEISDQMEEGNVELGESIFILGEDIQFD